LLGWFQSMHLVHHATHDRNYFFVSGLLWDVLLGTASTRTPAQVAGESRTP
jgi:sterol desaturase/sphingolipid hydroxylase (fatty acid hydroxylase superfamily)